MIEEKRIRIMREIESIPEEVLDNILSLVEESKKTTQKENESAIDYLVKKGVLKPPISSKKRRIRHTPIKGEGKPLSEMIIEDRR
jgi:hypothetical protein